MSVAASRSRRWGVILAGGDGKRLLPLTRGITGDERPKQFCDVIGDGTLLHMTRRRTSSMIPPWRTLLVLTASHHRFFREEVAGVPPECLVVQPGNRGTAPAILYSLLRVHAADPDASVAIFPSDHYVANGDALSAAVDAAFTAAARRPDVVVMLGIVPDSPEVSYGWIEPSVPLRAGAARVVFRVRRFWEKPGLGLAHALMRSGCLWNSFVMAGRVRAFLDLFQRAQPTLTDAFLAATPMLRTNLEPATISGLYAAVPSSSFSEDVLRACPTNLAVLPCADLGWSDLGEPDRVHAVRARA